MFRRLSVACVALAVLLAHLVAAPTGTAHASTDSPVFERQIGGRSYAGVYPWGIEYNPVTNTVFVGDYLNVLVREWTLDGREINAFYRPPAERTGIPHSIGIDPRNGDVYVPEQADGGVVKHIAKYAADGTFLYALNVTARYQAWIHVDDQGYLLVADAHYWNGRTDPPKIRKYSTNRGDCGSRNACEIASFGSWGSVGGSFGQIHGIDTDAQGNIYVADGSHQVVKKFTSKGLWIKDFGFKQNGIRDGRAGALMGDLRGVAVDRAAGLIYVADSDVGQIEVFTLDGEPVRNFGGVGNGPGEFSDGARQLTVDGEGNVWAADYGNFRVHKYAPDGSLLAEYPEPARDPALGSLAQPRDVAVDDTTGDIFVAETHNHRFSRFSADGVHLTTRGQRGSEAPWGMNYPRGISVNPVNGDVWVSNTREHKIRVYSNELEHKFDLGNINSSSTGNFAWPIDVEFWNGRAYVADSSSGVVKMLEADTGREVGRLSRGNQGLAIDPASGRLFVLGKNNSIIYVYDSNLSYRGSFGGLGSGAGRFGKAWDAVVAGDRLYVTDAQHHNVEIFTLNGTSVGTFGSVGSAATQFRNPSGIDVDSQGNLYIADAGNDRIQVWSTTAAAVTDHVPPTLSLTSSQFASAGAARISGWAVDDVKMGTVEVAIRDRDTKRWWDSRTMSWQDGKAWSNTSWDGGPSTTEISWSYNFTGAEAEGRYWVQARARDAAGHLTPQNQWPSSNLDIRDVEEGGEGEPPVGQDLEAPSGELLTPALHEQFKDSDPWALSGTASDDTGVSRVTVGLRNRSTGDWLQADGTWTAAFYAVDAELSAPGALETDFSWTVPDLAPGNYGMSVNVMDQPRKVTTIWRPFSIVADIVDEAPTLTLESPAVGAVLVPEEEVSFAGTATDDIGVSRVVMAVRDRDNQLWLQTDGTWGEQWAGQDADLDQAGSTSTGFLMEVDLAEGNYGVAVKVIDTAGQSMDAWRNVTVR